MVRLDDMIGARVRIGGEWYAFGRGHRDLDTGQIDVLVPVPAGRAPAVMGALAGADRLTISLMGDESEVTLLRGEMSLAAATGDSAWRLWMQSKPGAHAARRAFMGRGTRSLPTSRSAQRDGFGI